MDYKKGYENAQINARELFTPERIQHALERARHYAARNPCDWNKGLAAGYSDCLERSSINDGNLITLKEFFKRIKENNNA